MAELTLQLPVDSTDNKNKMRVLGVFPAGTTEVLQEVVVLADDDGNLLLAGGYGEKALVTRNARVEELLEQVVEGIAHLCALLIAVGRPDDTSAVEAWINDISSDLL